MIKKSMVLILALVLSLGLTACGSLRVNAENTSSTEAQTGADSESSAAWNKNGKKKNRQTEAATEQAGNSGSKADSTIAADEQFSDRDMEQEADLSEATNFTLSEGKDITITTAGIYMISGSAKDASIIVEALDEDKVQIVLDGVTIENSDFPCIYVKNADKVFLTTTASENSLSVTGNFTADGDTNTDAAIFSKDDLVLNGAGTLNVTSTDNGITSKDDLKITGGTVNINCASDALEANDSIRIANGTITVNTKKDGLHAENDEDNTAGYIYISGGTLNVTAGDDAIHGTTVIQIDGGTLNISAAEGLEATVVRINDGTIDISASDDGINAGQKSSAFRPLIEINGGTTTIQMGGGDTDGIDSNGDLTINGGVIDITGQSPFDCDGEAQYNGGTITVNGQQVDSLTGQFMGGPGNHGGQGMPGKPGFGK